MFDDTASGTIFSKVFVVIGLQEAQDEILALFPELEAGNHASYGASVRTKLKHDKGLLLGVCMSGRESLTPDLKLRTWTAWLAGPMKWSVHPVPDIFKKIRTRRLSGI